MEVTNEKSAPVVDNSKKEFSLPNKQLKLKPIKKVKGINGTIHLQHDANFLFKDAKNTLSPEIYRKGTYRNILTPQEQAFFEDSSKSGLSFSPGDLAPRAPFWQSKEARLRLGEDTSVFDLSQAWDYLRFAILRSNEDLVCLDPEHLAATHPKRKLTYLYGFEPMNWMQDQRLKNYVDKSAVYRYMFQIENNKNAMINMLTMLNPKKRVPANADIEFLKGELNSYLENDIKIFYRTMKVENLEVKAIIQRAIQRSIIVVDGITHKTTTGDILGENANETIEFLSNPENQKVLDTLKVKLDS